MSEGWRGPGAAAAAAPCVDRGASLGTERFPREAPSPRRFHEAALARIHGLI